MTDNLNGRPRLMDDPQFKRRFHGVLPRILEGKMSYGQAAELCGCSKKTIIRLVRISQGLPPERIHEWQTMTPEEHLVQLSKQTADEYGQMIADMKEKEERHYNTMKELYAKQEWFDRKMNGKKFWKEVLKDEEEPVQELINEWLDN